MSSWTTKIWLILAAPIRLGSGNLPEHAMLTVGRVRSDLGLPFAEIGGFGPGRTVDHLGAVALVDRQIARHRWHGRVVEPISHARPNSGDLEDCRHVVLVVNPVEFGLELSRNVHLHDIDVSQGCPLTSRTR